ncbi:6071_t:CDS:1, partial [Funneliformis geosporum]
VNSFDEEDDLTISRFLNLDADAFINSLDEIIEDSLGEDL